MPNAGSPNERPNRGGVAYQAKIRLRDNAIHRAALEYQRAHGGRPASLDEICRMVPGIEGGHARSITSRAFVRLVAAGLARRVPPDYGSKSARCYQALPVIPPRDHWPLGEWVTEVIPNPNGTISFMIGSDN